MKPVPCAIRIAGLAVLLLLTQCRSSGNLPDPVGQYFPPTSWLRPGIAHKYYFHYKADGGDAEISTNVNYRTYQLTDSNTLVVQHFDVGFSPVRYRVYEVKAGYLHMLEDIQYYRQDTFEQSIIRPEFRNFQGDTATLAKRVDYGQSLTWSTERQESRSDTLIEGQAGIVFSGLYEGIHIEGADTTKVVSTFNQIFLKGVGLFLLRAEGESGASEMELIEQMPIATFEQRRNHGLHRVGYIDPDQALGYHPGFQLCTTTDEIIDYYNPDPDIHYKGGKYALWKAIRPQLDPAQLKGASGYLTFRFVINCSGEAGRFITEAAGLDFQTARFPQATTEHLGAVTASLTEWVPAHHRGEPADAYAYLTYKLKDGELVELLP